MNGVFFYDKLLKTTSRTISLHLMEDEKIGDEIITGFLTSYPEIGGSNTWGSAKGSILGDIADFANSMKSPTADMGLSLINKLTTPGGLGDSILGKNTSATINKLASAAQKFTNAHFLAADEYVKSFSGTSIKIEFSMSAVLIPGSIKDAEKNRDTLLKLVEVGLGTFTKSGSFLKDEGYEADNELTKVIDTYFGLVRAPNGYTRQYEEVMNGKTPKGSFAIRIGNNINYLKGFLIQNINIIPSSHRLINKDGSLTQHPASYEVSISLEEARLFDGSDLKQLIT